MASTDCPAATWRVATLPSRSASERFNRLAHAFMQMQFDADGLPEPERVAFVTERLRTLEANGGTMDAPSHSSL